MLFKLILPDQMVRQHRERLDGLNTTLYPSMDETTGHHMTANKWQAPSGFLGCIWMTWNTNFI